MNETQKADVKSNGVHDGHMQGHSGALLEMTAQVVASYLVKNPVTAEQLPALINSVHHSLKSANDGTRDSDPQRKPAVSIRRSIQPDYIVCLEDGKKLKMLKRHLRTNYRLTPEEYRAKWNLPPDYPMVAPNYAAQRSAFAKKIGLGRTSRGGRRKAR